MNFCDGWSLTVSYTRRYLISFREVNKSVKILSHRGEGVLIITSNIGICLFYIVLSPSGVKYDLDFTIQNHKVWSEIKSCINQ